MRPVLFILFILITSFMPNGSPDAAKKSAALQRRGYISGKWVVERNSTLAIDGSSNINKFTCDINEYLNVDTLWSVNDAGKRKYMFHNSHLRVDIRRFDCHHKYITADFRRMLKVEKHPNLVIHFISLDEFHREGMVKGIVDIELAGTRKRTEVMYNCTQNGNNQIVLKGEKMMKFSDFELEPPRKLAGLIRINEDINVHFSLYFRKLNS